MGIGNESALIIGAGHYSRYGGHISIGEPMLTREKCYDSVFLRSWDREWEIGIRASAWYYESLDIGNLNSVIAARRSIMHDGKTSPGFLEELEANVVGVDRDRMWVSRRSGLHSRRHA